MDSDLIKQILSLQTQEQAEIFFKANPRICNAEFRCGGVGHLIARSHSMPEILRVLIRFHPEILKRKNAGGKTPIEIVTSAGMARVLVEYSENKHIQLGLEAAVVKDDPELVSAFLCNSQVVEEDLVVFIVKKNALKTLRAFTRNLCPKSRTLTSRLWSAVNSSSVAETLIDSGFAPSQQDCDSIKNSEVAEIVLCRWPELFTQESINKWIPIVSDETCLCLMTHLKQVQTRTLETLAELNKAEVLAQIIDKFPSIDISESAIAACRRGAVECLKLMIPRLHSVCLPLMCSACEYGHLDIAKILEESELRLDVKTDKGETALHVLAQATGEAIGESIPPPDYEALIDFALDRLGHMIEDKELSRGDTALIVAVRQSNWTMAEKLIKSGALITTKNAEMMDAFTIAKKHDSLDRLHNILGEV